MQADPGDVSGIQRRYSFTLLMPSSWKVSLAYSVLATAAVAAAAHWWYGLGGQAGPGGAAAHIAAALAALAATQALDSRFIRRREYSKALHMSFYGTSLWLLAMAAGLAAARAVGAQGPPEAYIGIGAMLFAGFRLGLMTTTLGVGMGRALALCAVQPACVLLAAAPAESWGALLLRPEVLGYGAAFLAASAAWSRATDAAGRPAIRSTHRVVQAYISSRGGDYGEIESIIEAGSRPSTVSTRQLRLVPRGGGPDARIVLPGIHPGPYHPIGGSNIPYLIYRSLGSQAMVMHSISDHSLNLPSRRQVRGYLESLRGGSVSGSGATCAEPVVVQVGRARVTGLLFGRSAVLFLSLSPHGMEDVPPPLKAEIEAHAEARGYGGAMLVDCHNAMGGELSDADAGDMLKAARSCLDAMVGMPAHPLEFGYANSEGTGAAGPDLAGGGLGVLCLRAGGKEHFVGWADSNNMENGVREHVVERLSAGGRRMLEVCTSDTHYTERLVRTRQGYHQLGGVTDRETLAGWFARLAGEASAAAGPASFEVIESSARVRVMGSQIFEDYRRAIDRSLRVTAAFAAGCAGLFATTFALLRGARRGHVANRRA